MAFTYGHLYKSDKATELGIDNFPGVDIEKNSTLTADYINDNLKLLYQNIISPIIDTFGESNLYISSAYRCDELNKALGASSTSQHVYGLAADLALTTHNSRDLFNWCIENLTNEWSQLIWEYPEKGDYYPGASTFSWVHVSWADGWNKKTLSVATNIESIHQRYLQEGFGNRVGKFTHDIPRAYIDIEY